MDSNIDALFKRAATEVVEKLRLEGWRTLPGMEATVLEGLRNLAGQMYVEALRLKQVFSKPSPDLTHLGVLMVRFLAEDKNGSGSHFASLQARRRQTIQDFFIDFGVSAQTTEKLIEHFLSQ